MGPYFPEFSARFRDMMAALAPGTIAVVGHARPDGDCIGAQVALARVLRSLGRTVVCANPDPVPRRLKFLAAGLEFLPADALTGEIQAIFVDCADHSRAGEKMRRRFPKPVANVDHHLSNTGYADRNFVDTAAAATCEILAGMFFDNDYPIDAATAAALYAGIITDTGQFRFSSTTQQTFELAAGLVARGARPAAVGEELYERETPGKLRLLQRFLASFEMEFEGRVCIGTLANGVFAETGTSGEDTEGLVDYARSMDGVQVGVLIEFRPDGLKASLRSKDPAFRLDRVAAQFGGGGHACAAGLSLKGTEIEGFRARLLSALRTQISAAEGGTTSI
ncbi:MAG TPA: DHH family phosphoesterase [Opitutaceae bacterium]|jgi:phosphoesterase RecJ-like protein|nr:DHH family phosphoesterase [Opitutaceae bacterium]HRE05152.1 DHH family phosphoesterase [Opitutaceae bacterium]